MHRGAIVRIYLKSFLTYDDMEVCPGSHLNLIIGPNGTGKSTLVAAIVLGLGGAPSVLGRSKQLAHFVKDGHQEADIVIELCDPVNSNCVIHRHFDKDGRSIWRLNDAQATQRRIHEIVATFNIQVDNLCQVLPQERVQDFSRMDPSQLLENTERAAGYEGIIEDHNFLKKASDDLISLQNSISDTKNMLRNQKEKLTSLQLAADNQLQREKYLDEIKQLKLFAEWWSIKEIQHRVELLKEKRKSAAIELKTAEDRLLPVKVRVNRCDNKLSAYRKEHSTLSCTQVASKKRLEAIRGKMDDLFERIQSAERNFQSVVGFERDRQSREIRWRDKLSFDRSQLQSLTAQQKQRDAEGGEDLEQRLRQLDSRMSALSIKMSARQEYRDGLERQGRELSGRINSFNSEIERLRNVGDQRLQMLRAANSHVYQAVLWLRQNRHRFSRTIHEPMILLLKIENSSLAKYVQASIAWRDLMAFTCEDNKDMNLFIEEVRDRLKLRVSCLLADMNTPLDRFESKYSLDHLKSVGFSYLVADLFTCPDAVRQYILSTYNLHNVPVASTGEDKAANLLKTISASHLRLNNYMIADTRYKVKRSRYSNLESTVTEQLRAADSMLTTSVDCGRVERLQKQISEVNSQLQQVKLTIRQLDNDELQDSSELDNLRLQKKEIIEVRDSILRLQVKIRVSQTSLEKCEAAAIDVEGERASLRKQLQEHAQSIASIVKDYLNVCEDVVPHVCSRSCINRVLDIVTRQRCAVTNVLREHDEALQRLRQNLDRRLTEVRSVQREAEQSCRAFYARLGVTDLNDLWPALGCQSERDIPSLENVESLLREKQARLEMLSGGATVDYERCALQEYGRLVEQRQKGQKRLSDLESQLSILREETIGVCRRWYTELHRITERVSRSFSNFFSRLGCVGEVVLASRDGKSVPTADIEDVDAVLSVVSNLGVSVRVQYRSTERLSELSASQHSGGERSVATMVYLISLQSLQVHSAEISGEGEADGRRLGVPFRCVDEINQGMDEFNERRMFDFLVNTVSNTEQYFLVTPKLLPKLEYPPSMKILCVFNSPTSISHCHFSIEQFCRVNHKRKHIDC